jgi:hypothetical protein
MIKIISENVADISPPSLGYQTKRLRELLREIMRCCQERMLFEFKKGGLSPAELKRQLLFDQEHYLTVAWQPKRRWPRAELLKIPDRA